MGDPKKLKKKYSSPRHPWQKARIEEERIIVREYALKNKREVYKVNSFIKRYVEIYKELNYKLGEQAEKEKAQLLAKVKRLGLIAADKELSAVLDMKIATALERRLQTIVFRKKLARSMKQARQFIIHRHITVGGTVIDAPGYLVPVELENQIGFIANSALVSELHPERAPVEKKKTKKEIADEAAAAAKEAELELEPVEIIVEDVVEEVVEAPAKKEEA